MKIVKIEATNAANIKKFMKMSGIDVVRCKANGQGLLISVANTPVNLENAVRFFENYNLTTKNGEKAHVVSNYSDCVDYCTLYRTNIL